MRKVLIGLAVVVVLVVALVVFLFVHEFDSPSLGQALLGKIGQATGVNIRAKQFKLKLLNGLVLEGVEASSTTADRQLTMTLDRLVFEHRLGPLLAGQIAVDKILLERPRIDVIETAKPASSSGDSTKPAGPEASPKPTPPPAQVSVEPVPVTEDRRLSLELREMTIQDAHVTLKRAGEAGGVTLDGLTLNMNDVVVDPNAKSLAALSGRGEIHLASGTLDTLTFKDAQTRFELANSRFDMPELSLLSEYGRLTSKTTVDFNPRPFIYHLEARGDGIDLNKMIGSPGGLGAGSVSMTADGEGTESSALRANGTVKLAPGTLPAIPALRGIDRALSKSVLVEQPYKATDARFTLAKNVLTLAPFRVEVEHARVDLDGTATKSGALDIDVALATPISGIHIDGVGAHVLEVVADANGWAAIPISITGTLENPRIRPDGSALVAQTKQGVKREAHEAANKAVGRAKEKAGEAIRRSLGGRPR
jgi:hypothetical protein